MDVQKTKGDKNKMKYTDEQKQEIKKALLNAKQRLGENGEHWGKGKYVDEYGNICLSEAVGTYTLAWDFMCEQVGDNTLSHWNDQQTSFAPVKAELDKALESLKTGFVEDCHPNDTVSGNSGE